MSVNAESFDVSTSEQGLTDPGADAARSRLQDGEVTPFASLPGNAAEACAIASTFLDLREGATGATDGVGETRERAAERIVASLSTRPDFVDAPDVQQLEIVRGIRSAGANEC